MANEASEVRAFGDGAVYIAPVGSTFPTNVASSPSRAAGWKNLGYISKGNAPKFSFGKEVKEVEAWQSPDPVRTLTTKRPRSIKFDALQTNRHTLILALGGGTVTEPTAGNYLYTPPALSATDEYALIVEGIDGDYTYRFCYQRVEQQGTVEIPFMRGDETTLAIDLRVLQPEDGSAGFTIQSNDPNLALLTAGS